MKTRITPKQRKMLKKRASRMIGFKNSKLGKLIKAAWEAELATYADERSGRCIGEN